MDEEVTEQLNFVASCFLLRMDTGVSMQLELLVRLRNFAYLPFAHKSSPEHGRMGAENKFVNFEDVFAGLDDSIRKSAFVEVTMQNRASQ